MSRIALAALEARAIVADGAMRAPMPCVIADFREADLVIALKEAEHRPLIERRFAEVAGKVIYWSVDDIEFAPPSIALAMIDDQVRELVATLQSLPLDK
jgi:protein-tyrosine phosphatase